MHRRFSVSAGILKPKGDRHLQIIADHAAQLDFSGWADSVRSKSYVASYATD